jgi:hypothetical protein
MQWLAFRYHVWDENGRELFRSETFSVAPTSVAWRPAGDTFVVAMHNRILLCDAAGWVASSQSHNSGSALAVAWTLDSVAFAAACGDGSVFAGHVLDVCLEVGSLEVYFRVFSICTLGSCLVVSANQDLQLTLCFGDHVNLLLYLGCHVRCVWRCCCSKL